MTVYNGIGCREGILFIKPRIKFVCNEKEYREHLEQQAYSDAVKARRFCIICNDVLEYKKEKQSEVRNTEFVCKITIV